MARTGLIGYPRPCALHFSKGCRGYPRAEQTQEIADSLKWGQLFPCHEAVDDEGEEEGEGCPSQFMQVAEKVGDDTPNLRGSNGSSALK